MDLVVKPGRVSALVEAVQPKRNLPEFDGDRIQVDAEHVAVGDVGAHAAFDVGPLLMGDAPIEFRLLQFEVLVG